MKLDMPYPSNAGHLQECTLKKTVLVTNKAGREILRGSNALNWPMLRKL